VGGEFFVVAGYISGHLRADERDGRKTKEGSRSCIDVWMDYELCLLCFGVCDMFFEISLRRSVCSG